LLLQSRYRVLDNSLSRISQIFSPGLSSTTVPAQILFEDVNVSESSPKIVVHYFDTTNFLNEKWSYCKGT
jgi:hypothetical protein